MENKIILAYLVYLPLTIALTLYVARMLFKNAKVFMLDIFKGKEDIALATNKLFEIGFYLLNVGFALLIMKIVSYGTEDFMTTNQELVEVLARKIGGFSIYLGIMLFLNMYMFFRGRKKARQPKLQAQPVRATYRNVPHTRPNNPNAK